MTFTTLMAILGVLASALGESNFPIVLLIPYFLKTLTENDSLNDRLWIVEEKIKRK
jgi:hypothetical protein